MLGRSRQQAADIVPPLPAGEIKGNFASSDLPSTVDVYQGSF